MFQLWDQCILAIRNWKFALCFSMIWWTISFPVSIPFMNPSIIHRGQIVMRKSRAPQAWWVVTLCWWCWWLAEPFLFFSLWHLRTQTLRTLYPHLTWIPAPSPTHPSPCTVRRSREVFEPEESEYEEEEPGRETVAKSGHKWSGRIRNYPVLYLYWHIYT